MFERYTEAARRALFFARYEATELRGTSIETEHLLLGLLRGAKGVTSRLFASAHLSHATVRAQIEARNGEQIPTSVEMAFSEATKRVLHFAADESDELTHSYIGTEHLLLGLLREEQSIAASILMAHGLRLDSIRHEIRNAPEQPAESGTSSHDRIEAIRMLVGELSRAPTGGIEARELVEQIHVALDALRRGV